MGDSYSFLASEITETGVQDFKKFSFPGASIGGARGQGGGFDVHFSSGQVKVKEPFNLIGVLVGIVLVAVVAILFLPMFRTLAASKTVRETQAAPVSKLGIEYITTPTKNDNPLTFEGVNHAQLPAPSASPIQISGADEIATSIAASTNRTKVDSRRMSNASKKHGHETKSAANESDEVPIITTVESAPNTQNPQVDLETLRRLQGKM